MMMRCVPLVVLAAVAVAGCSGERHETVVPPGQQAVLKGLALHEVKEQEIADRLEAVGTVKARNGAVVAARLPGVLISLSVKEGDRVRKGQVIATLEANEASASASAARAGVDEARKALEEARSRKKLADATFQRYQTLFDEEAVTRQEYETRRTDQEVAAQAVGRAESRLEQAEENARSAMVMAGYTRIASPLNGIVTAKAVDRGATLFPGMPIVTVEEDSGYLLEVQAPESLKGRVSAGQLTEVMLDGRNLQTGRVAEVVPLVDSSSRTFTVKLAITGKHLRSGMYGRAFFPVGSRKGVMIPRAAVVERGALISVWVVDAARTARMRLIKVGRETGDNVEVLSGLTAGERIVADGAEKVTDGAKVE